MAAKASGHYDVDNGNMNNAPYKQLENKMLESFKQMEQNTIHPSEVANVILQAVKTDNPELRYVIGNDASMVLESRRNLSDNEFQNFMKKQFNL